MFLPIMELTLAADDRADLERLVRATTSPAGLVRRARCILLLADGASYAAVRGALDVTDHFIAPWKHRFLDGGLLALVEASRRAARIIGSARRSRPRFST